MKQSTRTKELYTTTQFVPHTRSLTLLLTRGSQMKVVEKFTYYRSLGLAYERRFEHLLDIDDLHQAVEHNRMAVATIPEGDPAMAQILSGYGTALLHRHKFLPYTDDLREAIEVQSEAVRLTPSTHPARWIRLHAYAAMLGVRFQETGELEHINMSVKTSEEVVSLFSGGEAPSKAKALLLLASGLHARHLKLGVMGTVT